jgi:hypothetical protein
VVARRCGGAGEGQTLMGAGHDQFTEELAQSGEHMEDEPATPGVGVGVASTQATGAVLRAERPRSMPRESREDAMPDPIHGNG